MNRAKYLSGQPPLAINPDPRRLDGILIAFGVDEAGEWVARAVPGRAALRQVTMAQ